MMEGILSFLSFGLTSQYVVAHAVTARTLSRVRPRTLFRHVRSFKTFIPVARALEIPLYQIFYDGDQPPELRNFPNCKNGANNGWGRSGKDARLVAKFCHLFSRMEDHDLGLVLLMAQEMARRKG